MIVNIRLKLKKLLRGKKSDDILKVAVDAETRNCEQPVIRELYNLYFKTAKKEEIAELKKTRSAKRALGRTFFDVVLLSYFNTIKA